MSRPRLRATVIDFNKNLQNVVLIKDAIEANFADAGSPPPSHEAQSHGSREPVEAERPASPQRPAHGQSAHEPRTGDVAVCTWGQAVAPDFRLLQPTSDHFT